MKRPLRRRKKPSATCSNLLRQPSPAPDRIRLPTVGANASLCVGCASLLTTRLLWPANANSLAIRKIIGREKSQKCTRSGSCRLQSRSRDAADIGLILAALPPAVFANRLATAMGGRIPCNTCGGPPTRLVRGQTFGAYQIGYWLVIALFNVFPLPQLSGFRESFRFAGRNPSTAAYSLLVFFPEGEVNKTETGDMASFQIRDWRPCGKSADSDRPGAPRMGVWQMRRQGRRLAHSGRNHSPVSAPRFTFSP